MLDQRDTVARALCGRHRNGGVLIRTGCMLLAAMLLPVVPLPPAVAREVPAVEDQLVDPKSISALERMGSYLVSMKSFELRAATAVEVVLDNEQKIQVHGLVHYLVRTPDRLKANIVTDTLHREIYYDGRTVTFAAPEEGFHATADAPPTIRAMLAAIVRDYGLTMPLTDLFDWGTANAPVGEIEEGFLVGDSVIEGVSCDHWAFRMDDLDWEIWIQKEGPPLPRKFSIVDRTDRALPRYEATLDWVPDMPIGSDLFTFHAPGESVLIGFLPLAEEPAKE